MENTDPIDRLDNALMDIHDASTTLLEVGEARKDRVLLYLAHQLLSYHQLGEEAADQMQQLDAKGHPALIKELDRNAISPPR